MKFSEKTVRNNCLSIDTSVEELVCSSKVIFSPEEKGEYFPDKDLVQLERGYWYREDFLTVKFQELIKLCYQEVTIKILADEWTC